MTSSDGSSDDSGLGMHAAISRRDFVNGVAATSALAWAGRANSIGAQSAYPPGLMGMRGTPPGSFEAAHAVRDAGAWNGKAAPQPDAYDLVVVGAGLSGLAAAHFYRERHGANAKILVLDPQDDFGGTARRNEFTHLGRRYIACGGAETIYPGPAAFDSAGQNLFRTLGIDMERLRTTYDRSFSSSHGLEASLFFDREHFGADRLVLGERRLPWREFLAKTPLAPEVQADIARLYDQPQDYLSGLSLDEKISLLEKTSYADFLVKIAHLSPGVIDYFDSRTHPLDVVGIDATPALSAWLTYGLPGFAGLGLPQDPARQLEIARHAGGSAHVQIEMQARQRQAGIPAEPREFYHFPDGNASIASALINRLIPGAGTSPDAMVVTSRIRYDHLDRRGQAVRIRLRSTVVRATNTSGGSEVTYLRNGRAERVKARHTIMACYHSMLPFVCPEMPEPQRQTIHEYSVRAPIVITNVLVRDWRPWVQLGTHRIEALKGFHTQVGLDAPVSLGDYRFPHDPAEPIVLRLLKSMARPGLGLARRTQLRVGRAELLQLQFTDFERAIREQLNTVLGPGGFDSARDILGITVNRWSHGYAPMGRDSLVDPVWPAGGSPWDIARQRLGSIAIAGADSGASPLLQAAFEGADRAVGELVGAAA